MKSSLHEFYKNLDDLRFYMKGLDIEDKILSGPQVNPRNRQTIFVSQYLNHFTSGFNKRRFDYNGIVVSLYGFFEQYIESTIKAYVVYMNRTVPRFSDLPSEIHKNHLQLSLDLLSRSGQSKYKDQLMIEQVISNMNSCYGVGEYRLNEEAFSQHDANFRIDNMKSIFSKIGVDGVQGKILKNEKFQKYISRVFSDRDLSSIDETEAFKNIDDLAERRNEVSHGMPSQILPNQTLYEYILFFKYYSMALFEVLFASTLYYESAYHGVEIGKSIGVFNKNIVCLNLKNVNVKVGDILISKTNNTANPYIGSSIKEIQVNNKNYRSINAVPSINVGLRVSYPAKNNHIFYLVRRSLCHYT